jgi:signal transduction histidine kinase
MLKAIECARIKHDTNTLIPYLANYFIKLKSEDDNFKFTENQKKDLQEFNVICDAYSKQSPYNELIRSELNFSFFLKENKTDSLKIILDKMDKLKVLLNNPTLNNELAFIHLRYNFKIGNPIKNENKIIEIAESFEKNEMWWEAWRIYKILYSTAKSKGDFKSALNYFEKFYVIEIQIQNMNNKGQIYEMDVKYQTDEKNQEIAIQAEKLKIKQQNIGLLLSGLLIVTLSFFAYFIWQKKKIITEKRKNETLFTQKLMENTEEERMRIAKDLHDSVGHELLSIKNSIINKLQFTEEKIDHVLNEVREISRNLFPVMFEEVGLKISIEQLAENIKQTDNFYVGTEINYIAGTLSVKSELQVYRIIQEALNNTRKYANAQSAMVSIIQEKNEILVAIKDNGKGFDVMDVLKSGKAFGLLAINQRCNALNTQANIVSDKNGTSISFQIPIKHV